MIKINSMLIVAITVLLENTLVIAGSVLTTLYFEEYTCSLLMFLASSYPAFYVAIIYRIYRVVNF